MSALHSFLRRHRRIALDTSVFIHQVEANPRYVDLTDPVFAWLNRPDCTAVTSTITMTEVLVPAYRKGGEHRVDEFYALLTEFPNLDWVPPSLEIADIAARIRTMHRLRTPDAIQAATGVYSHATGLITNDPVFERVKDLEPLILDRLLSA